MNKSSLPLLSAAFVVVLSPVHALEVPPSDKSAYTLFNPTPRQYLRDLSTDRPDVTESAYTVDAGHVQIEIDFINYTRDRSAGAEVTAWNTAPINFKIGLLNYMDLQVVFDSYIHEKTRGAGKSTTTTGVGDLTFRLKMNLWGNDGGQTALALMPFLKLPTHSRGLGNDSGEGGLIIPFAVSLPGDWGMGLMTEVDVLRNEADSGYHVDWVNSITFSHDLVGDLGGYVEFVSVLSAESGSRWQATFNMGLTYALTADIQLDGGCNIGVTDAAEDLHPFVGASFRF
jgi:hypothetical protein